MDPSTFTLIVIALCLATPSASTTASPATSATTTMEEVIVTGTHIEVERYDGAAPLHTLSRDDIERMAMPSLGHIMAHQTFNYGSNWISNEYARTFQDGNQTSANLRGLGSGATLLLMNGQRTVDSNLNNLYPQIAVDRVETVLNGASDLMVEIFGDTGRHARFAVATASLPQGAAVEVDGIFEIE